VWIPNNGLHPGVGDSIEEALKYMEAIIGDAGPASTPERKLSFLENGPKMVKYLASEGFKWVPSLGYPDYEPDLPGGKAGGRSIEGEVFNINSLGKWKNRLNLNPDQPIIPMHTYEFMAVTLAATGSLNSITAVAKVLGWRAGLAGTLIGRKNSAMGVSLVGQLLGLCAQKNIKIWTDSPMKQMLTDNGKVIGAVVEKNGQKQNVEAKAVILAAGGFAHNGDMRKRYQEAPVSGDWSSTPPADQGDAVLAAMEIGAKMELLDDAWWFPSFIHPTTRQVLPCMQDRALPHSIVVDRAGKRFTDEAQSYTTFCQDQYKRNRTTPAIPAWLIIDSRHRKRYMLAGLMPGKVSQKTLDTGLIVKADSLQELAETIKIDPHGLKETVERFNTMAVKGVDEDYHRGSNAYDNFFGDPKQKPNVNLGTIEKPPFYATNVYPGDLGTKGGVLTDQFARAIGQDGSAIPNLYAVGNTSASVMGRCYPGSGSTLGPALTFGYIAVNDIARQVK
jgi:3-oxosteroid 1-dehydrogenase